MRKIFAVGESLLDVISKNKKVITERVGGSMLNASVSVAKMGLPVFLISEIGLDREGEIIDTFLSSVGVKKVFIYKFKEGNTAIARATLNDENNAEYTFEKHYPSQRLKIEIPDFTFDDVLLFGSIYSIENEIAPVLNQIISAAQRSHSLIFYDPNIRKINLKKEDTNKVLRNIHSANIIRASDEDFRNVFDANNFEDACLCIPDLNFKIFIYTCAQNGVYIHSPLFKTFYDVPKIEAMSTIGAGDSFNAGLIHAFICKEIRQNNILKLDEKEWREIITHAIRFASNVCMSYDNYISDEFAQDLKSSI